ncbi:gp161 [Bacillus phage G]|uniref:Gp161 n=1 Tax=Bacillus phage G TaxID=2884420 RepID=G3MBM7_9CAUD|nr:gp161 [Bacillus phage G]AEO93421.1 gp161 [Bacillus phage G]
MKNEERYKGYIQVDNDKLASYYEGKNLDELCANQYLVTEDGHVVKFN